MIRVKNAFVLVIYNRFSSSNDCFAVDFSIGFNTNFIAGGKKSFTFNSGLGPVHANRLQLKSDIDFICKLHIKQNHTKTKPKASFTLTIFRRFRSFAVLKRYIAQLSATLIFSRKVAQVTEV